MEFFKDHPLGILIWGTLGSLLASSLNSKIGNRKSFDLLVWGVFVVLVAWTLYAKIGQRLSLGNSDEAKTNVASVQNAGTLPPHQSSETHASYSHEGSPSARDLPGGGSENRISEGTRMPPMQVSSAPTEHHVLQTEMPPSPVQPSDVHTEKPGVIIARAACIAPIDLSRSQLSALEAFMKIPAKSRPRVVFDSDGNGESVTFVTSSNAFAFYPGKTSNPGYNVQCGVDPRIAAIWTGHLEGDEIHLPAGISCTTVLKFNPAFGEVLMIEEKPFLEVDCDNVPINGGGYFPKLTFLLKPGSLE